MGKAHGVDENDNIKPRKTAAGSTSGCTYNKAWRR